MTVHEDGGAGPTGLRRFHLCAANILRGEWRACAPEGADSPLAVRGAPRAPRRVARSARTQVRGLRAKPPVVIRERQLSDNATFIPVT